MQKKNVLTMALSVSLVGVIAVGGTLAYLSDQTTEVTNTFTFDDAISIDLKEHNQIQWDDETEQWKGTADQWDKKDDKNNDYWVTGNTYNDVLPGDVIQKDPTVKFNTVPANGANLYVSVSGLNENLTSDMDVWSTENTDGVWYKIANIDGTTADNTADGIYAYVSAATADSHTNAVVNDGSEKTVTVFSQVTIGQVNNKLNNATVDIKAYSVQATGNLGVEETRDQLAIEALKVESSASQD